MNFACVSKSALLIATTSLLFTSCSDSTAPKLPATSYELMFYEYQTLPVETRVRIVISAQPGDPGYSCSDRLTGMSLHFLPSGSFTQTESRLLVCNNGSPDTPSTVVIQGTYEVKGATVVLTADLGGGSSERSTAEFTDNALTIYHRELLQDGAMRSANDAPLIFVPS